MIMPAGGRSGKLREAAIKVQVGREKMQIH